MEVPDSTFNDFPLRQRKHYDASSHHGLGKGLVPVADEKLVEHLNRTGNMHHTQDQATAGPQQAQASASTHGSSQWVTSYQSQTAGDTGPQRRAQGRRCVPQPSSNMSLFSGFGERHISESERVAQLQLGTTKASQHLPGYTGHITHTASSRAQPVAERDLDKSKPLIIQNYNPMPGLTKRFK